MGELPLSRRAQMRHSAHHERHGTKNVRSGGHSCRLHAFSDCRVACSGSCDLPGICSWIQSCRPYRCASDEHFMTSSFHPRINGRIESDMSILIISLLSGLSIYLGARLHAALRKIGSLQENTALLKRRLARS